MLNSNKSHCLCNIDGCFIYGNILFLFCRDKSFCYINNILESGNIQLSLYHILIRLCHGGAGNTADGKCFGYYNILYFYKKLMKLIRWQFDMSENIYISTNIVSGYITIKLHFDIIVYDLCWISIPSKNQGAGM